MRFFLFFVVVFVLACPRAAQAHEARTAQIEVEALSPTDARVTVIVAAHITMHVIAPEGCSFDAPPAPTAVLHCPGGLIARDLAVDGFGTELDLAFVRLRGFPGVESDSSVITARAPRVALPGNAPRTGVAWRYLRLGFEHVLSGLDHMLFIVALFWQAWAAGKGALKKTAAELARTATAFTLAHSVTLALTVLGKLHVSPPVAEACIAFSLVLVALDLDSRRLPGPVARVALAAAFGLVHGMGFAGALAETRLPSEGQWTALLAFNGGVEVGQLSAFVVLGLVVLALRSLRPGDDARISARLAGATAWVVGSIGSAMFLLRAIAVFR